MWHKKHIEHVWHIWHKKHIQDDFLTGQWEWELQRGPQIHSPPPKLFSIIGGEVGLS